MGLYNRLFAFFSTKHQKLCFRGHSRYSCEFSEEHQRGLGLDRARQQPQHTQQLTSARPPRPAPSLCTHRSEPAPS